MRYRKTWTHKNTWTQKNTKGLFTNYVISKLTYMVLQIMTQHDAIYLVGFLIMMNDGPSLLSLELALK